MSLLICGERSKLNNFFENKINIPNCPQFTKAYLVDLFIRHINADNDMSNDSLTLLYRDGVETGSFDKLQILGDWLMFVKSIYPDSLKGASLDYYDTLARNAYYRCYLILERQWLVYEQLADQFQYFTETINKSFNSSNHGTGFSSP